MPNYFRNLQDTLHHIDPGSVTTADKVRMWMSGHLRVVWTVVMMLVLGLFCLWAAFRVGEGSRSDAIVETVLPGTRAVVPALPDGTRPVAVEKERD